MFEDGSEPSEVKVIPETSPAEPFMVQRYKEESGFGYSGPSSERNIIIKKTT